jgi:hypothetical protein
VLFVLTFNFGDVYFSCFTFSDVNSFPPFVLIKSINDLGRSEFV